MKQRLGIAAAIMEKPEIVILDEPTNSLDEDGVDLVKHIVRNEKNAVLWLLFRAMTRKSLKVCPMKCSCWSRAG